MKRRIAVAVVMAMAACLAFALCGCSETYNPSSSLKEASVDASALKEEGVLHVGVNAATYPFADQTNGNMSGLEVDVAAAVAQELGLKVAFVDVGTDGVQALSGDEIDAVMGVEANKADGACWLSDSYAPSAIALFSMKEGASVPKKAKNPVIAAQTSSLSAWLVTRQYGADALAAQDDLKTVFNALSEGEVKYAAADAVVGSYMINSTGVEAHLIGLMQEPDSYCIGVDKGNKKLRKAIAGALDKLEENGVLEIIMQKWVGGPLDISKAKLTESAQAAADRG